MIRGLHGMFYSSHADELRAFLRDKLQLPFSDVGGGWLIFDVPEADIGVHPVDDPSHSGTHDISFYCDDIEETVAELRARGVDFDGEVQHQGWGSSINLVLPGGVRVGLYQPRYQKATRPQPRPAATAKANGKAKAKAKPAARAKKSVAARPAAAKSARRKSAASKPAAKKAGARKSGKRRR